jgi:hypothetical protein
MWRGARTRGGGDRRRRGCIAFTCGWSTSASKRRCRARITITASRCGGAPLGQLVGCSLTSSDAAACDRADVWAAGRIIQGKPLCTQHGCTDIKAAEWVGEDLPMMEVRSEKGNDIHRSVSRCDRFRVLLAFAS